MILTRPLALSVLCLMTAMIAPVHGQSIPDFPSESELARNGLTMAWWGQAVVDPKRDRITFASSDEQNVYLQASSGIITTFNAETGRKLWSNLIGSPDQVGYKAVTNDEQMLFAVGMHIYSLDKMTGELVWDLKVPNHPSTSPEIDESQIYVGTVDGSVFSYDLHNVQMLHEKGMLPQWTNRAKMWRFKTPSEVISPPISSGTTVSFASDRGILYGLSYKDKGLKFQFETDGKIEAPLGRTREFVFVPDTRSRMYCISQVNGRVKWSFSSGAPIRQQPIGVGKQLFAIPHREGLVSISIASGFVQWQQKQATEFLAASETRVYASDISNNLLILDRSTGDIIGVMPMRGFTLRVNNDRTDRIVLGTESGTFMGLRETGSEFPLYHLYPERQPILPLFADEEAAADDAAPVDETN